MTTNSRYKPIADGLAYAAIVAMLISIGGTLLRSQWVFGIFLFLGFAFLVSGFVIRRI